MLRSVTAAVRQQARTMATNARAMVYADYGDPNSMLNHNLSEPTDNQVLVKLLAAPINPSDINQVEGVYPSRPELTKDLGTSEPSAVGGNEGVFEVVKVGKGVKNLAVGDWAFPAVGNFGTWRTHAVVDERQLNPIKEHSKITPVQAGTVSINPATAYNMIKGFADMKQGDWFIQNGANSGVGRAAIQLGKLWGLKSINVVRDRPNLDEMKKDLQGIGADHVITEEQLSDKAFSQNIKEWTEGRLKLAMNCVGGKSATNLARQLSSGGHLVTYGGMAKQPVTLGLGDLIFKDIHAHGYWLSKWAKSNPDKRYSLVLELLDLIAQGKIKDVPVTKHNWSESDSDEEISKKFHEAMKNSIESKGKQIMTME